MAITKASIEFTYNCHVMRVGHSKKNQKYMAFRGGNGTGLPVVDLAEAYTLRELRKRVHRAIYGVPIGYDESK